MRGTQAWLGSLLRVRPTEANQALVMFTYLASVVGAFVIGRTVRDALFLSHLPIGALPLMYVVAAASVGTVSFFYGRTLGRARTESIQRRVLLGAALVMLLFASLLRSPFGASWLLLSSLYVAVEVVGALTIIQFWSFANELYIAREAKRLFGFIGAGGVVASVFGGMLVGALGHHTAPETLLFGAAWLLCLAAGITHLAKPFGAHNGGKHPNPTQAHRGLRIQDIDEYTRSLAGLTVVSFFALTLFDFQFKLVAQSQLISDQNLVSYFGYLYAGAGILSAVLQFFFTSRILERFGVIIALLMLPVALLSGAGAVLILGPVGQFVALSFTKGSEHTLRYTVHDSAMQILYSPISRSHRAQTKAFIDGILKPLSIAASGLLILALGTEPFAPTLGKLALFSLFTCLAWLIWTLRTQRTYVNRLLTNLRSGHLEIDIPWPLFPEDETVRVLSEQLHARETETVLAALSVIRSMDETSSIDLRHLLDHSSAQVRFEALLYLRLHRLEDLDSEAILALLSDASPDVRAEAVRVFCASAQHRSLARMKPYLHDPEPKVSAAATASLIRFGGIDGVLMAADTLKEQVKSSVVEHRVAAARILGEIQLRRFFQPLFELLSDESAEVRRAAIQTAGAVGAPELLVSLIYHLGDTEASDDAADALVQMGANAQPALCKVLHHPEEDLRIRRRIPEILARIGEPNTLEILLNAFLTPNPELRRALADSIARLRMEKPAISAEWSIVETRLAFEYRAVYDTVAHLAALASQLGDSHPLIDALRTRHREQCWVILRLLSVKYAPDKMALLAHHLASDDRDHRGAALELAENTFNKSDTKSVLPLLDGGSWQETLQLGATNSGAYSGGPEEHLEKLIKDSDPSMIACAIRAISDLRLLEFQPMLLRAKNDPHPAVRSGANAALQTMGTSISYLTDHQKPTG